VEPEIIADPVILSSVKSARETPPAPDELTGMPTEDIRTLLNEYAADLLAQPDAERLYQQFLVDYEQAIHYAWFISTHPGRNQLFGYTLQDAVATGAFGRVYGVTSPSGEYVAVKVLREELSREYELAGSFRRGVRAMRILEKHQVPGMIAYRDATEIPAFVSMEWVDGPNLEAAREVRLFEDWDRVLWAAVRLVEIIRSAHQLPEAVLHRDIRPANVMIRGGWSSTSFIDWELVVLDFDLSTFRGAREKSVLAEGSALGFLAPEQLDPKLPYSTRNAAVDAFGIGMTLLFLCMDVGHQPDQNMQRRADFNAMVRQATRRHDAGSWRSLPRRIERLIMGATKEDQAERWDLARILRELRRLQAAESDPLSAGADLLCEEIVVRCLGANADYEWDAGRDAVLVRRPTGLELILQGQPEAETIDLLVSWVSSGAESRDARWLPARLQSAAGALRHGPWTNISYDPGQLSMRLSARLAVSQAREQLVDATNSLGSAITAIKLSEY
jgi:eukaryotic-like serine/threonine-protein kinase